MSIRLLTLVFVLSSAIGGCSGEATNRLPLYKVKGKVTLNGAPVIGADVTFFNEEAKKSAFGRTDDTGSYLLTTYAANDGAVEGKHAVKISLVPPPPQTPAFVDIESADYVPPGVGMSTEPPAPKSTLPQMYADFATSGLIAVVNTDAENVIDFDLK